MEPLDFVLNVQDPFAAVMSGFNNGQNRQAMQQDMRQSAEQNALGLRQGEQGLVAGQQAMDLNASQEQRAQTAFDQGQTDRATAMATEQQATATAAEKAAAMQADLTILAEKVQDGTATQQDFAALTLKYPELATELASSMDAYEPERKRAEIFDVSRVASALQAGNPDLAVSIAQERADAARNAGLAQDAAMWQGAADTIKASPEAGLTMAGLMLQGLDADAFKAVFPEGSETDNVVVGGSIVDRNTGEVIYSEPPKGPEWRAATPEEAAQFGAAAGQINNVTGKFDPAPLGRNQTTSIDPTTGMVIITESTGNGTGEPTVGQVYNPNEVANVISMIDEISENPALNRVVGPLQGGGGNNVDDLSAAARAYYGGEGLGLIERIGQLQSNAWLSARQMLKGGGAITDYESRKAEAAVARLSRAKSEEEFKSALADLRSAILEGQAKLDAARAGRPAPTSALAAPPPAAPITTQQAPAAPQTLTFNPETGDFE